MPLTAKSKPSGAVNYDVPDAGNQPAVLVAMIDLGTQEKVFTDTKTGETKTSKPHQVQLVWELTTQAKSDKENHVIGRVYTLSISNNSNLVQLVTALTGKKFAENEEYDIDQLIGKACLLTVVHGTAQGSGRTYARVEGAADIPKDKKGKLLVEVPPAKHKPVVWAIEDNDKLPQHLASWLPFIPGTPPESPLDYIRRSKEWKEKNAARVKSADEAPVDELADEPEADVPF